MSTTTTQPKHDMPGHRCGAGCDLTRPTEHLAFLAPRFDQRFAAEGEAVTVRCTWCGRSTTAHTAAERDTFLRVHHCGEAA